MSYTISKHWRQRKPRLQLTGCLCAVCARPVFPPKLVCSECECIHQKFTADSLAPDLMVALNNNLTNSNPAAQNDIYAEPDFGIQEYTQRDPRS
jgi:hypothetical protein